MHPIYDYGEGMISPRPGIRYPVFYYSLYLNEIALAIRNISSSDLQDLEQRIERFFGEVHEVIKEQDNVVELSPKMYPIKEYDKSFQRGQNKSSSLECR